MAEAMDRRSFLARSAATTGGALAAGTVADLAISGEAGAVTKGGTLKIGVGSADTAGYGPAFGKMDAAGFQNMRLVYDPLLAIDSSGNPRPYLAESVTPNANHTVWTIKLRSGVKFHDGSTLTSADLAANVEAWLNPKAIAHYAVAQLIAGVKIIDGLTVQVTTNVMKIGSSKKQIQWVTFPHSIAEQQISYVQKNPSPAGDKNPVGTGPFKFVSCGWGSTSTVYYTKNTNYWRTGLPYLNAVEVHPIPSGVSRLAALQSGSVDVVSLSEPQQIHAIKGNGSYTYIDDSNPAGYAVRLPAVDCIQLNCSTGVGGYKSAFLAPAARKALAMALNRHQINTATNYGVTNAADACYPTSSVYGKPSVPFPAFSASAAAKAAKAAGLKSFNLMTVSGSPSQASQAALIQAQCQAAGITCNIKPQADQTTLINNALNGLYDATLWNQFGGTCPDLNWPWWTDKDGGPGALVSINMSRNFDDKINTLMMGAMAAGKSSASNKLWSEINSQLNVDLPYMYIDYQVSAWVSKNTVKGWTNPTIPASPGYAGGARLVQEGLVANFTEAWIS